MKCPYQHTEGAADSPQTACVRWAGVWRGWSESGSPETAWRKRWRRGSVRRSRRRYDTLASPSPSYAPAYRRTAATGSQRGCKYKKYERSQQEFIVFDLKNPTFLDAGCLVFIFIYLYSWQTIFNIALLLLVSIYHSGYLFGCLFPWLWPCANCQNAWYFAANIQEVQIISEAEVNHREISQMEACFILIS